MNLSAFKEKQTLDEIISGWYIQGNEIVSSTDPSKSVKYEKFEKAGNYLKIDTQFGEKVYVLENNNEIYKVEKEIGEYSLFKSDDRYILVRNGKISSEFDKINWKVEDGIAYGEVERNGKYALIKFDGEEKLSDWYDGTNWNPKVENGTIYCKVWKDGKWALMKFNGDEKLFGWYDYIYDWEVEDGIAYVKFNKNDDWKEVEFKSEKK